MQRFVKTMDIFIQNSSQFKRVFYIIYVFYVCILLYNPTYVLARACLGRDQCSCVFDDDESLIALNSLGNRDGTPRFKDLNSTDSLTYSFNPCYPFSEGSRSCHQAAVCETLLGETNSIGDAQSAQFNYSSGNLTLCYSTSFGIRTFAQVKLVCDENACEPSLVAEKSGVLFQYDFTLTTVCACPNGCTEKGPMNCKSKSKSSSGKGDGAVVLIMIFIQTIVSRKT